MAFPEPSMPTWGHGHQKTLSQVHLQRIFSLLVFFLLENLFACCCSFLLDIQFACFVLFFFRKCEQNQMHTITLQTTNTFCYLGVVQHCLCLYLLLMYSMSRAVPVKKNREREVCVLFDTSPSLASHFFRGPPSLHRIFFMTPPSPAFNY